MEGSVRDFLVGKISENYANLDSSIKEEKLNYISSSKGHNWEIVSDKFIEIEITNLTDGLINTKDMCECSEKNEKNTGSHLRILEMINKQFRENY